MKTVFNSSEKQNTDTNRSRVRVGANRACVDALEKGRFLPSIALAYNIAAALAIYVYEVPTPWPNSAPVAAIVQGQPSAPSRNLA